MLPYFLHTLTDFCGLDNIHKIEKIRLQFFIINFPSDHKFKKFLFLFVLKSLLFVQILE